jgi:prepilin-type N-terminal cleavage/methylation domain-containing protein
MINFKARFFNRKSLNKLTGFTLVEILVAVAITSAALISMMSIWSSILRMNPSEGSIAQTTRTIAQIVMEDINDDINTADADGNFLVNVDSAQYLTAQ